MRRIGVVALVSLPVVALAYPAWGGLFAASSTPLEAPSLTHPFGTDDLGRDVLEGVLLGACRSWIVGLGTAALALVLGTVLGVAGGFSGGLADEALTRLTELFQVLPRFFVALAVVVLWDASAVVLIVILGLTSWSGLARLARGETLSLKEREFVLSARASGASFFAIARRHLLPALARPLLAVSPFIAGEAMLTEAGLAFLGIGASGGVSWGYLLSNAQPFLRDAWWMAVFPGLAITGTVLVLSILSLAGRRETAASIQWIYASQIAEKRG